MNDFIFLIYLLFLKLKKVFLYLYKYCYLYFNLFIIYTMTQTLITYLFVGVMAILTVIFFVIGLDKMFKIIIWNYILWTISFSALLSIDMLIKNMQESWFTKFLVEWKSVIIIILYALLLFLIYRKSKINIYISSDQIMQKSLYLLFVPFTVLSMCLTLEIILLGTNILSYESLLNIAQEFSKNIYLQQFIVNTPYLVLLHGLITVLITSEFKMRFKSDI